MAVVNDGNKDIPITVPNHPTNGETPVPPQNAGLEQEEGAVFVSIASYRDGERCGETLKSLFENAKDPDNVFVGLVEQNSSKDDKYCIEEYCKTYGVRTMKKEEVRADMFKVVATPERELCPHIDQIRLVAFHHLAAKGPMFARSMSRKVLGNEEFCLQVDAHSAFAQDWDDVLKQEWHQTNNEFAVLSTTPPPLSEKEAREPGGAEAHVVPRQCRIKFRDNGFPDYAGHDDKSTASNLEEPLLSHGYSAAFAFAKCHLEESVPYDPFSFFAMPVEQFSRYARLWTRGYDTYTPTKNVVFHDYDDQLNGHGKNEWFQRQRDRFRKMAIQRARSLIQNSDPKPSDTELANMGIYGLGKRRTLEQLSSFANLDFDELKGNVGSNLQCANLEWVPYDANISPVAHMYGKPDNIESQPEFPNRGHLLFYEQSQTAEFSLMHGIEPEDVDEDQLSPGGSEVGFPSVGLVFILWVLGLFAWCFVFSGRPVTSRRLRKAKKVGLAKNA